MVTLFGAACFKIKSQLILIIMLFSVMLFAASAFAAENSTELNENQVEVKASGQGATKIDALNAAWTEAVRLGVGMFVSSKAESINDQLTEEIVLHSRGRVNSYQVLREEKKDNIWDITILAVIDKDILQEAANTVQSQEVSVDLSHLAAQKTTEGTQKQSADELIAAFVPFENIEDYLDYSFKVEEKDGNVYAFHTLTVNEKKYKEIIVPRFTQLLDEISTGKSEEFYPDENAQYTRNYNKAIREGKTPYEISYPQQKYSLLGLTGQASSGYNKLYGVASYSYDNAIIAKDSNKYIKYQLSKEIHERCRSLIKNSSLFYLQFYVEIDNKDEPITFVTDSIERYVFIDLYNNIAPVISSQSRGSYGRQMLIVHKLDIPTDYLPFIKNMKGGYIIKKDK